MSPKIAVLGTGANGSAIAADLTQAGHDVVLIDQWPAHVEAMRADGLRIEMPDEELHVPVRAFHLCDVCTFDDKLDVVLLLMKAYDTRWACRLIEPYLRPDGLLVGVQNGMTVDAISAVVGAQRTVGCVIEVSSQLFTPGVVQRHAPPVGSWFAVGSLDPSIAGREAEIAEILRHSGDVSITDDIRAAKWMKLVSNATTLASSAIFGLPLNDVIKAPEMRALMLRAGTEALEAGQDLGYRVEPIFGLTPEDVRQTNRLVEVLLEKIEDFVTPETLTTVLQDHMKGRKSEVDDINGLVVAERKRAGKRAPVNAAIVEISRRIERGEIEPDPDNLALIREMIAA